MTLTDPSQYGRLEKLIGQGPVTVILVFSPSCPHCHTYMPLWKELQKTPNKQANMVTMEASVFDQTPLSEKKQIEGVPSVLKVGPDGAITEVSDIRNSSKMTNLLKTGSEAPTAGMSSTELSNLLDEIGTEPKPMMPSPVGASGAESEAAIRAVIPEATLEPNPLPVIPGMTSAEAAASQRGGRRYRKRRQTRRGGNNFSHRQRGGNPWAAFLASAGPAAVLAGAYAALPVRSSGLPPPQHSAKWRRIRARLTRRR